MCFFNYTCFPPKKFLLAVEGRGGCRQWVIAAKQCSFRNHKNLPNTLYNSIIVGKSKWKFLFWEFLFFFNCIESIFYFGTNNDQLTLWLYFNSLNSVVGSLIAHNISNEKRKSIARSLEEILISVQLDYKTSNSYVLFLLGSTFYFLFQYYRVPSL